MGRDVRGGGGGTGHIPWGDVVLAAIAAVSWAMVAMAGTAALGLHLLGADPAGALGPMTAGVVVLGAGGSVSPPGDVSAFGLDGAEAHAALSVTPLGVGLAGALFPSFFFLRSLRGAGAVLPGAELAVRVGAVVVMFVAVLGGPAWAGRDVVTTGCGVGCGCGWSGGAGGVRGGSGSGGVVGPGWRRRRWRWWRWWRWWWWWWSGAWALYAVAAVSAVARGDQPVSAPASGGRDPWGADDGGNDRPAPRAEGAAPGARAGAAERGTAARPAARAGVNVSPRPSGGCENAR